MRPIAVFVLALALAAESVTAAFADTAAATSVAPANAAEGDWVLAPKDYANTRFSALDASEASGVSGETRVEYDGKRQRFLCLKTGTGTTSR